MLLSSESAVAKTVLQIWISPITAQLPQYTNDTSSYHGYWQQNIYELNDKFGTESDLLDLSKALHDRGMVCTSCQVCKISNTNATCSILWLILLRITWLVIATIQTLNITSFSRSTILRIITCLIVLCILPGRISKTYVVKP